MIPDAVTVLMLIAVLALFPGARWLDLSLAFVAGALFFSIVVQFGRWRREREPLHQITRDVLPPMNQTLSDIQKRAARKRA